MKFSERNKIFHKMPSYWVIINPIVGQNTVNVTITRDLTIKSQSGNPAVDLLDGAGLGPIFRVWNVSNTTSYSIAFDGIGIQNFNASMNPFSTLDAVLFIQTSY